MDISEFLRLVKFALVPAVGWGIFSVAKLVKRRWLRLPIKVAASTVAIIGAALALLMVLFEAGCTKHAPPIKSPDGQYVAVLSYSLSGAMGDD